MPNVEDEILSSSILLDGYPYVFYNNHNHNKIYWHYKIYSANKFSLDFVPKDEWPLNC